MNETAFCRWHRLKGDRLAAATDAIGHSVSKAAQSRFTPLPVALHVNPEGQARTSAAAHEQVQQVLERREGIATPSDENAKILAGHVEHGRDQADAVAGRLRWPRLHRGVKPHQIKHRLQRFGGFLDSLVVSDRLLGCG